MDIDKLEQLFSLLKRNDISEFELNEEGVQLKLSRGTKSVFQVPAQQGAMHALPLEPAIPAAVNGIAPHHGDNGAEVNEKLFRVESPIVGTFYKRPSPDSDPFVKVGDSVKKGDTLCIVEAMKLMNEIDAPISGKIEKIFLTDGAVVEFGEILFLINPE